MDASPAHSHCWASLQVERSEADLRCRLESVQSRESAAASRLQELTSRLEALDQRDAELTAARQEVEKVRNEQEALRVSLKAKVWSGAWKDGYAWIMMIIFTHACKHMMS